MSLPQHQQAMYNKTRQSEYGCNSPELLISYSIDGSGRVLNFGIAQTADPEPPAKWIKMDHIFTYWCFSDYGDHDE